MSICESVSYTVKHTYSAQDNTSTQTSINAAVFDHGEEASDERCISRTVSRTSPYSQQFGCALPSGFGEDLLQTLYVPGGGGYRISTRDIRYDMDLASGEDTPEVLGMKLYVAHKSAYLIYSSSVANILYILRQCCTPFAAGCSKIKGGPVSGLG